ATWSSSATSGFEIASLTASNATVRNSANQVVGTGAAGLTLAAPIPASISGATNYSVTGIGDLSFYGPATNALGVSGSWSNYSATLTGAPGLAINTASLTLNGSSLPADTYTVSAASITVGGSGQSTTPSFAASASLTVTSGGVYLGPGSGTFTSAGTPVPTT